MQDGKELRQPWKAIEATSIDDQTRYDGHSSRGFMNQPPAGKVILQGGTGKSVGLVNGTTWKNVLYDTKEEKK